MILKTEGSVTTFQHGKHAGEELSEVAETDPSYLKWVHGTVWDELTPELQKELEAVMEDNDIET